MKWKTVVDVSVDEMKNENQEENLFNEILKILTKQDVQTKVESINTKTYKPKNILEIIFVSAIVADGAAAKWRDSRERNEFLPQISFIELLPKNSRLESHESENLMKIFLSSKRDNY